jgi:hypothetical protein
MMENGADNPVDFIASLAALVPKPRVNLTRFHGVLAPNHRRRGYRQVKCPAPVESSHEYL